MRNAILIVVDCDNVNINYQSVIPYVKEKCKEYYGDKHFWEGQVFNPICWTNEVITEDDLNRLDTLIDNSSIRLYGLNNFRDTAIKLNNIYNFPNETEN